MSSWISPKPTTASGDAGVLWKLRKAGFHGRMLRWVASYLHNRKSRVRVSGHCSDWSEWDLGLQQGAILAPLLFRVFVSDIFENMEKAEGAKFADDGAISMPMSRDTTNRPKEVGELQKDLQSVADWAKKWRMTLAPMKTKCICLRPQRLKRPDLDRSPIHLILNGRAVVQQFETSPLLGGTP